MKPHLRKRMRKLLSEMDQEVAHAKSLAACKAVQDLPEFAEALCVMLYMPIPGEIDCTHLALAAWQAGKTVVVPRVSWTHRHMVAIEITSLGSDSELEVGRLGIREPRETAPWPPEQIDLMIVPALAFDRRGHRLGRGGGFYDRFLAGLKVKAATCGLGFCEQTFDELPTAKHDHPVDILVTDKEVIRFNQTAAGKAGLPEDKEVAN